MTFAALYIDLLYDWTNATKLSENQRNGKERLCSFCIFRLCQIV